MVFVALSSVSVGSVMANQDVAAQLDQWVNTPYQKSSEITLQVQEKGLQQIKEATMEQQLVEKEDAVSKIESFLLTTLGQSKGSIENYQKDFQSRLQKAQTDLEQKNSVQTADRDRSKLEAVITDDVEEVLVDVLGE